MKIANLVLNSFVNDSRVLKTSKTLSSFDHDVRVVALHEDGLIERDVVDGIDVHRIKLSSRKWPKNIIIQLLKLFEFVCLFCFHYRRFDVIHCNDLNGLLVGFLCKVTRPGIILVYDSHEYAINDIPNQSRVSIHAKRILEGFLIRFTVAVINVSDSIAYEYVRLYGISKPSIVLNCPLYVEQQKEDLFREVFNIRSDQTIFLYQGGLTEGRGIELLIDVFSELKTDKNVLVFMGYGPLEDFIKRKAVNDNKIFFHSAVNPNVVLNYTSSADYGVSFIEDLCLSYRYCLPNKVFEYIMAGIPVLTSNLVEMKRLVENENIGVVASANDINGFKDAVEQSLAQDYTTMKNNVVSARKKYCWEEQEKSLRKIYDDL